jgi:UDP-2,4-diacetamido-2,4,6-trideoxy-beta-L-altropyranose hydrolase/UDP-4-amino-4,6-dideoxy-N-acetyl-beta-L-altrosamine N-acetyltransferase
MKTILFRADSSSQIGTGHIMRDLVLAQEFEDAVVIFVTQELEGNINQKIITAGYQVEILQSNELSEFICIVERYAADMVVIDHYDIDFTYEKSLKEETGVTLFVLDDTYEKHYCDILLNHNVYADKSRYATLVPPDCELRCAAQYTLIRDEFKAYQSKRCFFNNRDKRVLVAMGGADHSNKNIEILEVLQQFYSLKVDVITTTANPNLTQLKQYVRGREKITLHINTDAVAALMNVALFAIVTPSVTVNEVLYMKLPFIAIKSAQNQHFMYEYLLQNNCTVLEHFDAVKLHHLIKKLMHSLEVTLVAFTKLSLQDKEMVLAWRNHVDIRKWMLHQQEISLQEHLDYIDSLHQKKDRAYFLVRQHDHAIGVVDLTDIDLKSKRAEVGLYAKPGLKGVGSILMKSIINYAFIRLHLKILVAQVFKENYRAIKLYEECGFKYKSEQSKKHNLVYMELTDEDR